MPSALASATYDDANQITAWAGTSFTYDDNGNLTSDGTRSYTWNARNGVDPISWTHPKVSDARLLTRRSGEVQRYGYVA